MAIDLRQLPKKSGVYIFKDWNGQIIYIGSTVGKGGLSGRVKRYFNPYGGTIHAFEIAGIYWYECSFARELEKLLIRYFFDEGHPIRNKRIPKVENVPCRIIFERFNYMPVWRNRSVSMLAAEAVEKRNLLAAKYSALAV